MSYTVYGLRLKGDREPRYVGITWRGVEYRLRRHFSYSRGRTGRLSEWLNANRDKIEPFRIAETDDREVAKATEKLAIATLIAAGQRLLNQAHVPGNAA